MMSSFLRGSTTTLGTSRYGLASEAYRTRSIALQRTFSFPSSLMRSAFRSVGVPSTRDAGKASSIGGPSNRPMRSGFAENSFLANVRPVFVPATEYSGGASGPSIPSMGEGGQQTHTRGPCPASQVGGGTAARVDSSPRPALPGGSWRLIALARVRSQAEGHPVCGCSQYCMGSVSGRVVISSTSVRRLWLNFASRQIATPASQCPDETLLPRDNPLRLRAKALDAQ